MCATSSAGDPCLSVVLPVRNGMPFLCDAVSSILDQTLRTFELLVVDDSSRDGSREWLESVTDARLRLIASRGTGVVAALNTGLAVARGEFLARHDADDVSHPERFGAQTSFLREHPDVDVVGTLTEFIDELGQPAHTPWVADVRRIHDVACSPEALGALLPLTCGLAHGSVMARTSVLQRAGGYRPAFEWAEDYDLWLRLLPDHRFAKIPRRLYTHRLHARQVSRERQDAQLARTVAAKLEYICRRHPHVLRGTCAVVDGEGRGAAAYRHAAEQLEMTLANGAPSASACQPGVVVVSDVSRLDGWKTQLTDRDWRWEGNIAVRRPLEPGR